MKKVLLVSLVLMLALCWATAALAGSADEAKALVKQAIAMAKAKGVEATLKAVGDPKGPFIKGDLYVFAGSISKVQLTAHPHKPHLVGKDLSGMKDIKGKLFFIEFCNIAKNGGSGWVDYYWPKPGSKTPVLKSSYIEGVPGGDTYFGCGVYK